MTFHEANKKKTKERKKILEEKKYKIKGITIKMKQREIDKRNSHQNQGCIMTL